MSRDETVLVILDALISLAVLAPHQARAAAAMRDLFSRAEAEGRDLTPEEMAALRADADVADTLWDAALARGRQGRA